MALESGHRSGWPGNLFAGRWTAFFLAAILLLVVMVMSLIPEMGDSLVAGFMQRLPDKPLHLLAYLLVTMSSIYYLIRINRAGVEGFVVLFLGLSLFGLCIELLQPLTGRSRSLHDLLVNELGIISGILLYLAYSFCRTRCYRRSEATG